jgi:hypothetical protein
MNWNRDLGELSPRGRAALLGTLAVCCVVPMLVLFGALSITGAVFGGTAAVVVGAIAIVGWGAWMSRHHQHMTGHDHTERDHAVHDA